MELKAETCLGKSALHQSRYFKFTSIMINVNMDLGNARPKYGNLICSSNHKVVT
jgi:hypothetical protein